MINPIVNLSPTYCPKCKENNLVDIYTDTDKPIGYIQKVKFMHELNLIKMFYDTKLELSYCKCNKCKTKFKINWMNKLPSAYNE